MLLKKNIFKHGTLLPPQALFFRGGYYKWSIHFFCIINFPYFQIFSQLVAWFWLTNRGLPAFNNQRDQWVGGNNMHPPVIKRDSGTFPIYGVFLFLGNLSINRGDFPPSQVWYRLIAGGSSWIINDHHRFPTFLVDPTNQELTESRAARCSSTSLGELARLMRGDRCRVEQRMGSFSKENMWIS